MTATRTARLFLALLVPFAVAAQAPAPSPSPTPVPDVAVTWGVRIPLRDGVHLNATLYRADGDETKQPCVFTLTPYIAQSYHDRGMYFAAHGYQFLSVDVRGRGNSEGEFTPLLQEAKDAHDVVEWLAVQPYCNGKVAMWGGSYAGYDQWAAAKEFPPHLSTIVPVASPYAGVDFPMARNMFYAYDIQWLTLVAGRAAQDRLFGDEKLWTSVFKRLYLGHRPFAELDRLAGMPSQHFQDWIAHPEPDAYWDAFNPSAAQYAKIDLPILTITGQYDGDQAGAFAHYRAHFAHASDAAKQRHYLIVGPWDHAGTRTPQAEFGGLKFGPASLLDLNDLHRQWYDWAMKAATKPAFLKAPVAWYLAGAEEWRYAPTLDAITSERLVLNLDSRGEANDVFASGTLSAVRAHGSASDRYAYDPLDTGPAALADGSDTPGLTDQRPVLLNRGKSLVYHSAPFERDTDVAGFFRFTAFIAIDQPDTDFDVVVHEVRKDGTSIALAGDRMRARYREGARSPVLAQPGAIERYEFDGFNFTARRIAAGSRLRLVFGPVNSPFDQKNYNSGGVVARESAKDARTVTVTLYHDAEHPSTLSVPIAAASSVQ
jgi:uncharacterized protein